MSLMKFVIAILKLRFTIDLADRALSAIIGEDIRRTLLDFRECVCEA